MNRGPLARWGLPPPHLKKVKFFIYSAIVLKFETEHFYVYTNNIEIKFRNGSPFLKVKIILLLCDFETQHFHIFTNNN